MKWRKIAKKWIFDEVQYHEVQTVNNLPANSKAVFNQELLKKQHFTGLSGSEMTENWVNMFDIHALVTSERIDRAPRSWCCLETAFFVHLIPILEMASVQEE